MTMSNNFGVLAVDDNSKPMQSGRAFVTNDATAGGAAVSPLSFTSASFALVPPSNAVEFICYADVAIKITEETTILNGSFEIPANITMAFPCSGMSQIVFKAAGNGTLNFWFLTV